LADLLPYPRHSQRMLMFVRQNFHPHGWASVFTLFIKNNARPLKFPCKDQRI